MMNRLVLLLFSLGFSIAHAAEKPNIVLIFTDDQGMNDVGCYGSEIPTPNIDRIAAEGVKFTNFYSASSICTPSRFGLLTGRNPSRSRDQLLSALMFMAAEHKSRGIHADETTIAQVLSEKGGYETGLIGKWHLGHGSTDLLPMNHGFDFFRGHTGGCIDYFTMTYGNIPDWYHGTEHVSKNGYATDLISDEAIDFFAKRKDSETPFFLYLAYNAPHFGKGYSPKDKGPVNIMQPQAADLQRKGVDEIPDKIRREFAAMTVSLDDGVGRVLDALEANNLDENTLVIFLTDHGGDPVYGGNNEPLRGVKATLFEGGIKVPCVMRWPGKIEAGRIEEGVCSALDLFPTFAALAGVDAEFTKTDGLDISNVILGKGEPVGDRELFWETGAHSELNRKNWLALRQGDWKYVNSPKDGEFLFQVKKDPNEAENLAESENERFKTMQKRVGELITDFRP